MTTHRKYQGFALCFLFLVIGFAYCTKDLPSKGEANFTGHFEVVFDIDSNSYEAFGLKTQIWMASNLRTSRLNDGQKINLITDNTQWKEVAQPGYCWYNNDALNNKKYGALYNYSTVESGLICPIGWHVPSKDEWSILINALGGVNEAGGKMKNQNPGLSSSYWSYPVDFSNKPTFSAIPGGFRNALSKLQFTNIDSAGYWWALNSNTDNGYYAIFLKGLSTEVHSGYFSKNDGLSIRCIKD